MQSVNNDPRSPARTRTGTAITTNYCNGVTSDDVVAHEWGHAYTQFTHDLIYQWQPGALNESYSDIWGETVDLFNGVGTDSPAPVRARSAPARPTPLHGPNVVINSPAEIARDCNAAAAQFGPALTTTGLTGNVVLALDGTAAPGAHDDGRMLAVDERRRHRRATSRWSTAVAVASRSRSRTRRTPARSP